MKESIWIESRGYQMSCVLEYNKVENKGNDLIILVHGFTGTKTETHRLYTKLSNKLCNNGYTVLRFDFVGSGDSDGSFKDMTISGEIEDGLNILKYCRERFRVNNLYITGFSLGGCIASILASEIQSDALVLWSPVSNPFWNFHHIFGHEKFNKGLNGEDVDYYGNVVGTNFFKELIDISPLEHMKNYSKPVLLIHGRKDQTVLPLNSYCYNNILENSSLHLIEDADHDYASEKFEVELLNITVDFFKKLKMKL